MPRPFDSETAKLAVKRRTELRELNKGLEFTRSNTYKELFNQPVSFFTDLSSTFKEQFQKKYDGMDDKTSMEVIVVNSLMKLMLHPDPKLLEFVFTNVFGKAKEEAEVKTYNLPKIADPSELLDNLDESTTKMMIKQLEKKLSIFQVEPTQVESIEVLEAV